MCVHERLSWALLRQFAPSQAIKRSPDNLQAALHQFESERLPDLHALFQLDEHAFSRTGTGWAGKCNPHFWLYVFHLSLWSAIGKVLPGRPRFPELIRMSTERVPYREVGAGACACAYACIHSRDTHACRSMHAPARQRGI